MMADRKRKRKQKRRFEGIYTGGNGASGVSFESEWNDVYFEMTVAVLL